MGGQPSKPKDAGAEDGAGAATAAPGAASPAAQKEPVKGAKAYAMWKLPDVRKAREAARAFATEEDPAFAPVSRRQFWELFSDYGQLVGDAFLSLPMQLFEVFKDTPKSTTVNAIEVLLMLGLFCHAKTDEQLEFCFALFDFDGGGAIDRVRLMRPSRRCMRVHRSRAWLSFPLCPEFRTK